MNRFLLEIGTEEIPAGYIQPALNAWTSVLTKKLSDFRIQYAQAKTYGTPRRLTIIIDDVAERQLPLITEVLGPPEAIGFDANGQPTVAARKFAEKNVVTIDQIKIKETGKGRYLFAVKTEPGESTVKILEKMLPDVILTIPFPKTMRW
jgi:glycyl-tRNA synthetase beta chain